MLKRKTTKLPRHFLDIDRFDEKTLRRLLRLGSAFKRGGVRRRLPLKGKTLAMVFEQPSTRTRVSFEVGMRQLGGDVVLLSEAESQLGRGETIADTARVLSRYVDGIMLRTKSYENLQELAQHATVPVINGLTDLTHPCQIMADVMTFEERKGPITGRPVAWLGDGNNVAASWIQAAVRLRFPLRLACPEDLRPEPALIEWAKGEGGDVMLTENPEEAVAEADCIVTDVWVSMGDLDQKRRHNLLQPYQVNRRMMSLARDDAIFMHCLPAHRGEEVTADIIDGPQSAVWDEAENRLHAQKGVLAWCMS